MLANAALHAANKVTNACQSLGTSQLIKKIMTLSHEERRLNKGQWGHLCDRSKVN